MTVNLRCLFLLYTRRRGWGGGISNIRVSTCQSTLCNESNGSINRSNGADNRSNSFNTELTDTVYSDDQKEKYNFTTWYDKDWDKNFSFLKISQILVSINIPPKQGFRQNRKSYKHIHYTLYSY